MKTKKRTEIIFEKHEITRIRVARRPVETASEPVSVEVSEVPVLFEKQPVINIGWREKLRRFWKPNR